MFLLSSAHKAHIKAELSAVSDDYFYKIELTPDDDTKLDKLAAYLARKEYQLIKDAEARGERRALQKLAALKLPIFPSQLTKVIK